MFLLYQSLIPTKAQQAQVDERASCRHSISCRPLPVLCWALGPPVMGMTAAGEPRALQRLEPGVTGIWGFTKKVIWRNE